MIIKNDRVIETRTFSRKVGVEGAPVMRVEFEGEMFTGTPVAVYHKWGTDMDDTVADIGFTLREDASVYFRKTFALYANAVFDGVQMAPAWVCDLVRRGRNEVDR